MFISEKLVFIELHKTGCTHIGKLLANHLEGQQRGKHNRPPPQLLDSGRIFIGSVRNPWDWYVSLWAYGCNKKGLVYNLTTQAAQIQNNTRVRANHSEKWNRCYKNANDTGAFREWLQMMHNEEYWHDFGEGYGTSGIANFAGLMTYRYINLFCKHVTTTIKSPNDISQHEKQNCFIEHFIKMENLEEDFIAIMHSCGFRINKKREKKIKSMSKTNASSGRKETSCYYDDKTVKLVNERESIIIDRFSYTPPLKRL